MVMPKIKQPGDGARPIGGVEKRKMVVDVGEPTRGAKKQEVSIVPAALSPGFSFTFFRPMGYILVNFYPPAARRQG
jgi:hypothetical protein